MTPFRLLWCEPRCPAVELLAGLMPDETIPGVLTALSRLRLYWPQLRLELSGREVTRLDVFPGRDGRVQARVVARVGE